ncbi:hypothetical protein BOTBODRAFT_182020 [Botryobasidium botryosum FD-172 SS1]|uniref:Uncharacterized protein n=1 Tax=Botryobasidium botryosum (strain FD-172 SS1) TaxID=930990 RepID=A0A067LUP8_BOTB1|nr:hypothetical protein BOTBODRAFT_182020 [Botryobasidium botryosum FD-172 SS1]
MPAAGPAASTSTSVGKQIVVASQALTSASTSKTAAPASTSRPVNKPIITKSIAPIVKSVTPRAPATNPAPSTSRPTPTAKPMVPATKSTAPVAKSAPSTTRAKPVAKPAFAAARCRAGLSVPTGAPTEDSEEDNEDPCAAVFGNKEPLSHPATALGVTQAPTATQTCWATTKQATAKPYDPRPLDAYGGTGARVLVRIAIRAASYRTAPSRALEIDIS